MKVVERFRNVAATAIQWIVVVVLTLVGIEVGLRLWPDLIPLTLLGEFQPEVRLKIAQRRHLQNYSQVWSFPRDDGGPMLRMFKPFTRLDYDFRDTKERGTVHLDANGFCNPPKNPYDLLKIDIITVGDSFAWCFVLEPEATWSSQLGTLTQRPVYNLGRGGVGPYEYLQILKRFGLSKRPEFVVFNIYEGNDLRDAVRYDEYVKATAAGKILYADTADRKSGPPIYGVLLGNVLGRKSYAINLIVTGLGRAYKLIRTGILRATGSKVPARINFHYQLNFTDGSVAFNLQNGDKDEVRHARKLRRGEISLDVITDALEKFVALSREYGFTPIVSYSPSAYTAYADFVEFEAPRLNKLMPWYSRTQRQFFRDKAAALGYVFVDITPSLQAAARALQDKTLLYYPINLHFTKAGNQVVAETLARVITDQTMHQTKRSIGRNQPE